MKSKTVNFKLKNMKSEKRIKLQKAMLRVFKNFNFNVRQLVNERAAIGTANKVDRSLNSDLWSVLDNKMQTLVSRRVDREVGVSVRIKL